VQLLSTPHITTPETFLQLDKDTLLVDVEREPGVLA